ncbi:uncharacterized protein [Antedon mediterranea]|uniref:uncharacterized protein n=1 Tax=Antedon mediterranea TaxID=105859 RepID=UPI003AF54299
MSENIFKQLEVAVYFDLTKTESLRVASRHNFVTGNTHKATFEDNVAVCRNILQDYNDKDAKTASTWRRKCAEAIGKQSFEKKQLVTRHSREGHLVVNCLGWNVFKEIILQRRNCITLLENDGESELRSRLVRFKEEIENSIQLENGAQSDDEDDSTDEEVEDNAEMANEEDDYTFPG